MIEVFWAENHPGAITVCDAEGVIIYMNRTAAKLFEKSGGDKLVGSNVIDCHPPGARAKVKNLLETEGTAIFTVEGKEGKRLVYDAPWYRDGKFAGLAEISFILPENVRKVPPEA